MALDSKTKRAAVMGVARPWMRSKNPDAGLGEAWRVASGNTYPVASLSVPVAGVGASGTNIFFTFDWNWDKYKYWG